MARFSHYDMAGKVNSLKANLDERYKEFFCIIQELLQNADDAKASQVIIGQLNELSQYHCLCNIPGIFIINNGLVTESDLDHIFSIADSNKGTDEDKIGKFGLGMKSVFHLCESFFILGQQSSDSEFVEFFDPWDNENDWDVMPVPHPQWRREFEQNKANLRSEMTEKLSHYHTFEDRWFALWLPLRQREHCNGGSGALLDYYPLEERALKWFSDHDFRKIANMMPFFKCLRKITFASGDLEKYGSLELNLSNDTPFRGKYNNEWKGTITSDKNIIGTQTFHGWEWYGNKEMDALRNDPLWPRAKNWDAQNRCWIDQKDKTAPHAAICYNMERLENENKTGSLQLQQCVFLPLSEMLERKNLSLPYHITMSFHGQFFIDAGRRRYKLADEKAEENIRVKWNKLLYSELLMPKVLKTFQSYFQNWNVEQIQQLVDLFSTTNFWFSNKNEIAKKFQYLLLLTKQGWQWCCKERQTTVLELPPYAGPDLLDEIYHRINKDVLLKHKSSTRLGTAPIMLWTSEQTARVWDAVNTLEEQKRYSPETLAFLKDFIRSAQTTNVPLKKIQQYLSEISMNQYRKAKDDISEILQGYPHCKVGLAKDQWTLSSFEVWKQIQASAVSCLPLLSEKTSEDVSSYQYSEDDLKKILPKLEKMAGSQEHPSISAFVREMVCSLFKNCECQISPGIEKYKVFEIQETMYSYADLASLFKRSRLYAPGGEFSILQTIQKAVKGGPEILPQYYCDALKRFLLLKSFSAQLHVRQFFMTKPDLLSVEERMELLEKLKSGSSGKNYFLPVRYLLHGEKGLYDYDGNIEIPDISSEDRELFAIGSAILGEIDTNKPQLTLPPEMIANLSESEMLRFGIEKLQFEHVFRKLRYWADIEKICHAFRKPDTWRILLNRLASKEDFDLLASLPIWYTTDHRFSALGENCFVENEVAIPAAVQSKIKKLAVDFSDIERLLSKIPSIQIWSFKDTVQYCCKQPYSQESSEALWKAIKDHKEVWDKSIWDLLFEYPLFETISKHNISFLQIMPTFEWSSANIFAKNALTDQSRTRMEEFMQNFQPEPQRWTMFLSETLSMDSGIGIANLPEELCNAELFRKVFEDPSVMPIIQLLDDRKKQIDGDALLHHLQAIPAPDRCAKICSYLSKQYEIQNDSNTLEYLKFYIGIATQHHATWENVSLPNMYSESKPTSNLIRSADGVDPQYLLHEALRDSFIPQQSLKGKQDLPEFGDSANLSSQEFERMTAEAGKLLKKYFREWPEELYPSIGTFLALLGNNPSVSRDIREFVKREPKWFWSEISDDYAEKIQDYTLCIKIYQGNSISMPSLAGTNLSVPLQSSSHAKNMLIGEDCYSCRLGQCYGAKKKFIYLALRPIPPPSPERGRTLLINTIKKVLSRFDAPQERVISLFNTMKEVEQFDLETTRSLIMKELPTILRTMNLTKDHHLKTLLRCWNDNNRAKTQAEQSRKDVKDYDDKFQELLQELQDSFENDAGTREETLTGIRRRISTAEYGYEQASIPFELFQNADDAAVELQGMMQLSSDEKEKTQPFVIELKDQALNIIHWGRPINQFTYPGFDHEEGERLGYCDDLQKMLLLGVSDKGDDSILRTGKFGLGFKSVFLLTDSPLILSKQLYFSIQGGLLPKAAELQERKILDDIANRYSSYQPGDVKPTIFHFPFREGGSFDLEKFLAAAPLLVQFSRKINVIYVIVDGKQKQKSIFRNSASTGQEVWNLGNLQIAMGKNADMPTKLTDLPATIWVTSPTQIYKKFGFAVNGNFCIDVGRNQLLNCNENLQLAKAGATALVRHLILIEKTVSPNYWENLWNLFGNGKDHGHWSILSTDPATNQVLKTLIWGTSQQAEGYGEYIKNHDVVPTNLPPGTKYQTSVALKNVLYKADEYLTKYWNLFVDFVEILGVEPGTIIGHETNQVLESVYSSTPWKLLSLSSLLIQCTEKNPNLSPEMLNTKRWESFLKADGYLFEESWKGVKFKDQRGNYRSPDQLLVLSKNQEEESLRAAFAPPEAILSKEYSENAIELFRYIRKKMSIPMEEMSQWAINAQKEETRKAVCFYLKAGEKHQALIDQILIDAKKRPGAIWLDEWLKRNKKEDGLEYYNLVKNHYHSQPIQEMESSVPFVGEIDDETSLIPPQGEWTKEAQFNPNTFWEQLEQAWKTSSKEIIQRYNLRVYGNKKLEPFPLEISSSEDRERWMELFTIAAAHSLGRTKLEQHRGFINWCREKGYWDTFISTPMSAEEWINVLNQYIDCNDREYRYWMRLYPSIYLFAKYLDDYVQMFAQWQQEICLNHLPDMIVYRSNIFYQGTDFQMPDLKIGAGHIGMHFILRELYRSKTLQVKGMEPYSFVHSAENREFFYGEVNSEKMYKILANFLEDPTFGGNFDVAFQWRKGYNVE